MLPAALGGGKGLVADRANSTLSHPAKSIAVTARAGAVFAKIPPRRSLHFPNEVKYMSYKRIVPLVALLTPFVALAQSGQAGATRGTGQNPSRAQGNSGYFGTSLSERVEATVIPGTGSDSSTVAAIVLWRGQSGWISTANRGGQQGGNAMGGGSVGAAVSTGASGTTGAGAAGGSVTGTGSASGSTGGSVGSTGTGGSMGATGSGSGMGGDNRMGMGGGARRGANAMLARRVMYDSATRTVRIDGRTVGTTSRDSTLVVMVDRADSVGGSMQFTTARIAPLAASRIQLYQSNAMGMRTGSGNLGMGSGSGSGAGSGAVSGGATGSTGSGGMGTGGTGGTGSGTGTGGMGAGSGTGTGTGSATGSGTGTGGMGAGGTGTGGTGTGTGMGTGTGGASGLSGSGQISPMGSALIDALQASPMVRDFLRPGA
jgi:hypothetical protein